MALDSAFDHIPTPLTQDDLTIGAIRKLKSSEVLNEAGRFAKSDFDKNPWKMAPAFIPCPTAGLWLVALGAIAASTIVYHASKKEFRARFKEAAQKPIDPAQHLDILCQCDVTGDYYAPLGRLFKRHAKDTARHTNHLMHLTIEKFPHQKIRNTAHKVHQKLTKFDPERWDKPTHLLDIFTDKRFVNLARAATISLAGTFGAADGADTPVRLDREAASRNEPEYHTSEPL